MFQVLFIDLKKIVIGTKDIPELGQLSFFFFEQGRKEGFQAKSISKGDLGKEVELDRRS